MNKPSVIKRRRQPSKARRMKNQSQTVGKSIDVQIESMDSMGQGVAKVDNKPCFVAKTLPGECGKVTVTKASKGVMFAQLNTLDIVAENRVVPECSHFQHCPGCHYLHTDYQSELQYKRESLQHHLNRLEIKLPTIEVTPATQRLGYRNRIQLHYRHQYIGAMDSVANQVIEIPHCLVIDSRLKATMDDLYNNKSWASEHQGQGHCELYLTDEGVSVEWDRPYAHGGFSQVNNAMNLVLTSKVYAQFSYDKGKRKDFTTMLDLFSGEGNLSDLMIENEPLLERIMVDYAPDRVNQESLNFVHLDLFSETALRTFKARSKYQQFDVILVDPPRKGFPDLALWVNTFKPKKLIYVSCNAPTMVRDLQQLTGKYKVSYVGLIDLFPSTFHYEVLVTIEFG